MSQRIERALAELGADHQPKPGWEERVLAGIAGQRVEDAVAGLGADHEPKPGWQARVIAATAPKPRRRWWWLAVPAFAIAAVILVLVLRPRPPGPIALAVATERTGPIVRGGGTATKTRSTAALGDTLHATATGQKHRALWIYRDERQLIVACPGDARCRDEHGALAADVELTLPGSYTIVALGGDSPIAAPTGAYDRDVAAAESAGAHRDEHVADVR